MRATWLLLVSAGACANGSGAGAADAGPGGAACTSHAECDDQDACTTDVCDQGRCGVSVVDRCAEVEPVLADDFESKANQPLEGLGGWAAAQTDDCPVGLEVHLDDSFDYGKPAAFVDGVGGWRFDSEGGGKVELVATPGEAGGFSMNVVGTTAAGSFGEVMHQVTPQASGEVALRFWPPGNAKQKWMTLDEKGDSRFYLYFEADGQVRYSSGGSKVTLQPYGEDRWYQVRMAWDAGSDRVTVAIDGTVHADLPVHAPIEQRINRLRMRTASASGLSFMVDDVVASGGEAVKDGLASLRIGSPDGACAAPASAARTFDPVRAGVLDIDLRAEAADGPYLVELSEEGSARVGIELAPDGTLGWRQGERVVALPGSWQPGDWLHIQLRWDGAFDVWAGDDGALSAANLEPAQPIIRGLDELRVAIPPGGALWVDEVAIAGAR